MPNTADLFNNVLHKDTTGTSTIDLTSKNCLIELAKHCMIETKRYRDKFVKNIVPLINYGKRSSYEKIISVMITNHQNEQNKYCQLAQQVLAHKHIIDNINITNNKNRNALYYAAKSNCIPFVKVLHTNGCDMNPIVSDKNTLMDMLLQEQMQNYYYATYDITFCYSHLLTFLLSNGMKCDFKITKNIRNKRSFSEYIKKRDKMYTKQHMILCNILPDVIYDILLEYVF